MRQIKLPSVPGWDRKTDAKTFDFENYHGMRKLFITGIGTDVGKTVAAAILTEALEADYWKPIQSGADNDKGVVQSLVSNTKSVFHPEAYSLTQPLSPHAAAEIDGVEIELSKIILPVTNNTLIIEGAGGLMVPLNYNGDCVIDLIKALGAEAILISRHYLGGINHTLLSAEALKNRGIAVAGIVFNGAENVASEKVILQNTGLKMLGRIEEETTLNRDTILSYKTRFAGI